MNAQTLIDAEQIIVSTFVESTGMHSIQWWAETPHRKHLSWSCVAEILSHGLPACLFVGECPDSWLPDVWDAFVDARSGVWRDGNNSIRWGRTPEGWTTPLFDPQPIHPESDT